MLHRHIDTGTVLISQPAHAWVSGQLAAVWGNERFGAVEPFAEVHLAAEQHDIGWLEWEAAPTLNPASGLPRTFRDLPTNEHVAVWAPAGPRSLVYGPYIALLVSLHGTGLYQRHDFTRDTLEEAEAARRFIIAGAAFEEGLLRRMTDDPQYAAFAAPGIVARNRRLVAVWDALSLALCGGIVEDYQLSSVPSEDEPVSMLVHRVEEGRERFSVEPWPFLVDTVRLTCAGRLVEERFTNQEKMRDAIDVAPWQALEFELARSHSAAGG